MRLCRIYTHMLYDLYIPYHVSMMYVKLSSWFCFSDSEQAEMLLLFPFLDCPRHYLSPVPLSFPTPHHDGTELGAVSTPRGCVIHPPLCRDEDIQMEKPSDVSQMSKTIWKVRG